MSLFSHFVCLSPAYRPFVQSCRERRVCPFFHTLSLTCLSVLTIFVYNTSHFYVGRVTFITMRSNGTFPVEMTKDVDFSLDLSLSVSLPGELDQLRLLTHVT